MSLYGTSPTITSFLFDLDLMNDLIIIKKLLSGTNLPTIR